MVTVVVMQSSGVLAAYAQAMIAFPGRVLKFLETASLLMVITLMVAGMFYLRALVKRWNVGGDAVVIQAPAPAPVPAQGGRFADRRW